MTSVITSHPQNLPFQVFNGSIKSRLCKIQFLRYSGTEFAPSGTSYSIHRQLVSNLGRARYSRIVIVRAASDEAESNTFKDDDKDKNSEKEKVNGGLSREDLERIVGTDDSTFSGMDLATLIRKKYGRSYDVQLIKKEFMGRNLLAMNVMWKYMEQRSFPLTEEEYILRLDDIANTLKCWGAVSYIRNSLAKLKERPRIGKAVSIFIDMDETGGRSTTNIKYFPELWATLPLTWPMADGHWFLPGTNVDVSLLRKPPACPPPSGCPPAPSRMRS
ncbi:hypothetical protein Cni_G03525 [Canna indica]|uniref:Uncharacterized protein n=1 Tax=Canna indica TaxID=4628 RepID=A0AAQ3JUQ6_9LILI|nr:hypothetical protein Cni_G03525 [Canna indica]